MADHAQIDEPQVRRADQTVFGGVIQTVTGGDFPRLPTGRDVLVDDAGEGLVSGDVETAVATGAVPVAIFGSHRGECALESDAFGRGTVLDQGDRGREGGHQLLARLGVREPVDGGHQLGTMQFERAFQQFPFVARERATWAEYGGHGCLLRVGRPYADCVFTEPVEMDLAAQCATGVVLTPRLRLTPTGTGRCR